MMTKPELLMYCMAYQSKCMCQLTYADREDFIRRKLFKDFKAISNALYLLKKNGYVAMLDDGSWFLTNEGVNHLAEAIKRENSSEASNEPEHHCSKLGGWNDERGSNDDGKEEIARLQEENGKLKKENEELKRLVIKQAEEISILKVQLEEQHAQNQMLVDEVNALHKQSSCPSNSVGSFLEIAKAFTDIAQRLSR